VVKAVIRCMALWGFAAPLAHAQSAVDSIDVEVRPGDCMASAAGTYLVNRNTAQRVFATVRLQTAPAQYGLLDVSLDPVRYSSPRDFGVLLLPGEHRRIGCPALTFQPGWNVKFTYAKAGAYYPQPDLEFPGPGRADQYIRFFEQSPCGPAGQNIRVINMHPRLTISVSYKNTTPGTRATNTVALAPYQHEPVACSTDWANLTFDKIRYRR
jgi:hypothetical protein